MHYNDYLKTLSEKFARRLEDISVDFNFDYGDEFEIAICEILRDFLPSKYGIVRGFVVSKLGLIKGDDIIIYDQEKFPTLKLNKKDDYSRKENIPIEAVYAYIEAKHNLTEETLEKAIKQVSEVKELCSQREKVGREQYDPYFPFEAKQSNYSVNYPEFRNPIFTMILSRYATDKNSNRDDSNIREMLHKKMENFQKAEDKFLPELIIAGENVYSHSGFIDNNTLDISATIFLLNDKSFLYFTKCSNNLGYGIALANLFAALDWIRLGKMPWIDILNDGLNHK